jgi:restriction endonuclease Mrr
LKNAGLIEKPKRGVFRITEKGRAILDSNPGFLDIDFLMRIPEFRDFYQRGQTKDSASSPEATPSARTPDEVLQNAYESIREERATEIIDRLLKASPDFFENTVVELLVAMGYGGSRRDAGERIVAVVMAELMASSKRIDWGWMSSISRRNAGKATWGALTYRSSSAHCRGNAPGRAYS